MIKHGDLLLCSLCPCFSPSDVRIALSHNRLQAALLRRRILKEAIPLALYVMKVTPCSLGGCQACRQGYGQPVDEALHLIDRITLWRRCARDHLSGYRGAASG